jgi:hypothetical protein
VPNALVDRINAVWRGKYGEKYEKCEIVKKKKNGK